MCTSPLHIVNPSRWIDPQSSQQLFVTVPCGRCSECQASQTNEWSLRLYYEQLSAVANDCYVIFDTLTYSPAFLPRLSDFVGTLPSRLDFPCFSKRDIDLFLANLRARFGVGIRYFIASEYGHDHQQAVPFRPHYHCLFFVPNRIPPLVFSRAVSEIWHRGRTDGIPYRPASYVVGNVFRSPSSKVTSYVIKYVCKSFAYSSLVRNRINKLRHSYYDISSKVVYDLLPQRHYQSLSLGYGFLSKIYSSAQLSDMDSLPVITKHGFRHVGLPLSLRRKFFYNHRRVNGRVVWEPNQHYTRFMTNHLSKRIAKLASALTRVCASSLANKVAEYVLVQRGRFSFDNPFDSYSRDNVGLRNYSSHDRPLKFKIFTSVDIGSNRDGYSGVILRDGASDLSVFGPNGEVNYTRLDSLSKLVYYNSKFEKVLYDYYSCVSLDPGRKVNQLKDRISNLFKSYNLC